MIARRGLLASVAAAVVALVTTAFLVVAQRGDAGMSLEISLSERQLYEFIDGELVNVFDVSVGKAGHETITGDFRIHRIDWNPDWVPPDSEWAEDEDPTPPGHPDNPMGRVRMVYQAPYSIHGTEVLSSLGRAESHGSVRMANEDIIALARRVMQYGGVERSEEWYDEVLSNPETMYEVDLPNPVRLINYE
jgi:lipoprotein-anchoring transpeptidase ErfK/SrfK